ncbi:MAG TPA: SDR family NAD(P)-dependent oxidoreductase [Polyangiaceae bacterium]|nr:SDR family NAD(P)-dependent oxidoreductase [Polyangiaceae bacterium]
MRDLKGKVAVVTGAASGIGRAMAERFAREGMKVVLADVEEKPLGEAVEAIGKGGAEVVGVRTDVSKREDVETLARKTFDRFGAAHVLCNNAGVGAGGMTFDQPLSDWEWTLGVNLWGVIHGIRAFVPRMIDQGQGHVVNTASVAGLVSAPGMSAYCASKHAVVTISECLFHELGFVTSGKVKVSVLCPGWVKTNIADADRNRPASLKGNGAGPRPPQQQMMEAMMRQAIANGIPPSNVADQVLAAIQEERFWILTHPEMKKAIEIRAHGILEGIDPKFDPTAL